MFNIISQASGTADTIDSIKQRLSLRSEEKNLRNQRNNNDIILILTLTSIILGFMAVTSESLFLNHQQDTYRSYLLIGLCIASFAIILSFALIRIVNWRNFGFKIYRRSYKRKKRLKRLFNKMKPIFKKSSND